MIGKATLTLIELMTICPPSDDDFKCYFESVLNREDVNNDNVDDVTTYVTIPVLDEPISPAQVSKGKNEA